MEQFLYQALRARIGICISTQDAVKSKARFYAARKAAMDPALDVLQLRGSPDDPNHLWIIKANKPKAPTITLESILGETQPA